MPLKTKNLKNAIKGKQIPLDEGNVGYWVEDQLEENGYNVNRGKGIDLPDYKVEVKTRCVNSSSAHTIGRMTTEDIINTPYSQSHIKEKIQQWLDLQTIVNIINLMQASEAKMHRRIRDLEITMTAQRKKIARLEARITKLKSEVKIK